VALSWSASSGATSYNVYRGTTAGGESATAIASGITSSSYSDTGLTDGTAYYYKVAAVNSEGTSGLSNEASATPEPAAPAAPTGLTATAGNASVSLTWTASSGATSYNVYRGTTSGGESATAIASGITAAAYTDSAVTNGTTYYYKVAAVNAGGASGLSNEASATPEPAAPAAPTGLTATAGNASVSLMWTASSGAASYSVYRGTTSGGESATAIASGITATAYTDTGVTNGTKYYYKVAAVNGGGTSALSNEASATPELAAPAAPTGLTATAGNASVSLTWIASTCAASYNVYRGTTSGGESATAIASGISTTAYTDTTVTNGTKYYYKVAAVNGAGTSALSSEVSATPEPAKPTISSFTASPATIATGASSTLSWATTGAASIAITPGTFTSTSASGSTSVSPTATTTYTLTATNAAGSATATAKVTVTASGGPLTITTTSCPGGTQLAAYAGCTITASGGTPPYTYSLSTDVVDYPPLPEGMSLNAATGVISSSLIGGQGTYIPELVVTDSTGATATQAVSFAINGSNAFLANIFPSTSIFHHRVDAATTGLPVDTSPAAPMYSAYLPETVKPFFGDEYANFPNGIPAIEVPYNQPDVSVTTTVYQSDFTSGPIPAYAPVEGTANSVSQGGDGHVLVYLEAGGGNKPAEYEMWQGIYKGGPWTDSSNALWPDVTSNNLTPQGGGTTDAAGLPVAPLLANADEVIGTGTPSAPNGTIQHPIRFTLNHMLNYWVWPATQTAGTGYCTTTGGADIPVESEIAQSASTATSSVPYPATCSMSGAAGEIYRLKASVATPSCASTSPQAAIIITAFRNYGIILADNGDSGGLIGTPDARWNNNDLECITNLILSDFEPVNVSSLMVSNDSGATSK
jgi:fibronectin type 3 domain-containing protein